MGKHRIIIWLLPTMALCLALGLLLGFHGYRAQQEQKTEEALRLQEQGEEEQRLAALSAVEEFTGVLDADGLAELERYPNLRRADLSGSEDYAAILAYMERHPLVEVLYTVDLGGTLVDNRTESLRLAPGDYSMEKLRKGLPVLPRLSKLTLEELFCQPEEIFALQEENPEKKIDYTVRLSDTVVLEHTEALDLTLLEPEQAEEAIAAMRLLPELKTVDLTDPMGGNRLDVETLHLLQMSKPETLFRYRFQLFGKEISTEQERIEFFRVPIGNEGVEELRRVLPCLTRCSYLLLDDCGIDDQILSELRDEFPQTKIVWRVHISYMNFLTDVKIIHLTFLLDNYNAQVMRFCNEVEYLDIGHNTISDIRFMGDMPHLKYVILSYNDVSDLSPLANCGELEMLELYHCLNLKNIEPLAACTNLKLLNVSWTHVEDISPVFGLKNLERFYCIWNYDYPLEQQAQALEQLPDCWITFEQNVAKNVGWSFDAAGEVRAQWYLDMYKILRYRVENWFFGDYPEGWNREEERFES